MKASLVVLVTAGFLLTGGVVEAGLYCADASATSDVTVSGSWSSVKWYESDGCYSGVGNP